MRVTIAAVVVALLFALPAVAQPVATSDQSIGWDYTDAQVQAGQVTRFDASFDGDAFMDVGFLAIPGVSEGYFTPIPAAETGTHTVILRACNGDFCGDPSAEFTYRLGVVPSTIEGGTIRIIPTPEPQP